MLIEGKSLQEAASVPLVTHHPENGFTLHPQALQLISSLPSKQCHIVGIVGRVKTGRSYLLNHIVNQFKTHPNPFPQEYFKVANGIDQCTTGIHLLNAWVQTPDQVVLFIDAQGLGSLNNTAQFEAKTFSLVLMLCSTIIYNNVGPIDQQALNSLGFMAQIGKIFERNLHESNETMIGLPSLMMVLRDFSLQLKNKSGDNVTAKEYLEASLALQEGNSQIITNKNGIKKVLTSLFAVRDCETLILPSAELPIQLSGAVRPQFQHDLIRLKGKLWGQVRTHPKMLRNRPMVKEDYLAFVKQLMTVFNNQENQLPKMENIIFMVYRKQICTLVDNFNKFVTQISNDFENEAQKVEKDLETSQYRVLSQIDVEVTEKGLGKLRFMVTALQGRYTDTCLNIDKIIDIQNSVESSKDYLTVDYDHQNITNRSELQQIYKDKAQLQDSFQKRLFQLSMALDRQKERLQEREKWQTIKKQFFSFEDEFMVTQSQKELNQLHTQFIALLQTVNRNMDPNAVENAYMRVENAYLRRKIELKDRQSALACHSHKPTLPDKCKEALREVREVGANVCQPTVPVDPKPSFLRTVQMANIENTAPLEEGYSLDQMSFINSKYHSVQLKGDHRSFYVPYIFLEDTSQMNVEIIRTVIKQDSHQKSHVEYVLEVVLRGKKWVFNRRWKDFSQLGSILANLFDPNALPAFEAHPFGPTLPEKQQVEARRAALENYLCSLLEVGAVRNSRIMQKFVKINKQYVPYL